MAWVQGPTAAQAASTSVAKAFASSTPAGNLIVAVVTQQFGAFPTRSITNVTDSVDGANLTFITTVQDAGPNGRADIYYRVATTSGTRTITVNFSGGSAEGSLAINEYDNTQTVLFGSNQATGTATTASPGAVAPSSSALYIAGITDTGGVAITPDATWTQRQEVESAGVAAPINVHDKFSSGSQNPSTTLGTSPGSWNYVIAAFYQPGPTITVQPVSQTVNQGGTATFTVTATGAGTLSYQWKLNGSNISGATSSSYTTGTLTFTNNGGSYTCDVTDSNGTSTTNAAILTVSTWTLTGTGMRTLAGFGEGAWATAAGFNTAGTAVVAGSTTHTTSGALSADAATLSGTAAHLTLHTTSGSLTAQAATISGTAAHKLLHTTSGSLTASAATISGTAAHVHATVGALTAQAATLSGTALRFRAHATTGALAADAATLSGSATRSATVGHAATGNLQAASATLAGTATHLTLHTATGALQAGSAAISGTAAHPHVSSGALVAQSAALAGSAARFLLHTTSGALSAQSATVSGASVHTAAGVHIASGALVADAASLSGVSVHVPRVDPLLQVIAGNVQRMRKTREAEEEERRIEEPFVVVEVAKPRRPGRITWNQLTGQVQLPAYEGAELNTIAAKQKRQREEDELLLLY